MAADITRKFDNKYAVPVKESHRNGYWAVCIGDDLSKDQATALRQQAISDQVAPDAFIYQR
jgi:hypothetical protein